MRNSREQFIEGLESGLRGDSEVHLWSGDMSPWMDIVIVEPGSKVPPTTTMPEQFMAETGTYYAGIMSPDQIKQRLAEMSAYEPGAIHI